MRHFTTFGEFKDQIRETRADRPFESLRALRASSPAIARMAAGLAPEREALAADTAPARDEFEAEFAKMKEFLVRYYPENMECAHTYLDSNGTYVDCIPFDQQPTARTAGAAAVDRAPEAPRVPDNLSDNPLERPPLPTLLRPPLHRGLRDSYGNRVVCPSGCVTIPRITLDELALCGTLDQFFSKLMPVTPGGAGAGKGKPKAAKSGKTADAAKPTKRRKKTATADAPEGTGGGGKFPPVPPQAFPPVPPQAFVRGHRYATCDVSSAGPFFGCRSLMSVWQPNPSPGVFSLSQLWIVGEPMPNGNPCTVESGWMVYPNFPRGDGQRVGNDPVLFVFFNPDGYVLASQNGRSGYVEGASQTGFIRLSSGNGWPIMSSGFLQVSQPNNQVGFDMLWSLQDIPSSPGQLGWYLFMRNPDAQKYDALGYFEAGTPRGYGGTSLAARAKAVRFGGETAALQNQFGQIASGYGQMGSGTPPRSDPFDSARDVAFHAQIMVQTGGPNAPSLQTAPLAPGPTDRPHYDADLPGVTGFESFFFFGGAGAPFTGD